MIGVDSRRHQKADAARDEHAGQRDDEGRHLEDMDDRAHRGAEGGAEHEQKHERNDRRHAEPLDRQCHEHGGETDHGADGEIDAAGDDDKGHAGRDHAEKGVVGEEIGGDAGGGEIRELQAAGREADEKHQRRDRNRMKPSHGFLRRAAAKPASLGDCSNSTTITTAAFTTRLNSGG